MSKNDTQFSRIGSVYLGNELLCSLIEGRDRRTMVGIASELVMAKLCYPLPRGKLNWKMKWGEYFK